MFEIIETWLPSVGLLVAFAAIIGSAFRRR